MTRGTVVPNCARELHVVLLVCIAVRVACIIAVAGGLMERSNRLCEIDQDRMMEAPVDQRVVVAAPPDDEWGEHPPPLDEHARHDEVILRDGDEKLAGDARHVVDRELPLEVVIAPAANGQQLRLVPRQ